MYLRTNHRAWEGWKNTELFVPSYKIDKLVDTTGPGDNSIAGFMYGVDKGYSPKKCLQLAAAAGHLAVQFQGSVGAFTKPSHLTNVLRDKKDALNLTDLGRDFKYHERQRCFTGPNHTG